MSVMNLRALLNLTGDRLYALPLLVVYLTDGCNSRCVTCDIWQNPRRNMPPALVTQLAEACRTLGTRWVLLSGGEAMQHPDWPAIADQFRASGARVLLLTNGLFLRKQASAVIAHADEVIVSLDGGTAATYQAIRGVDAFDLVLDGIQAVRAGGIPVTTRTTIQAANFREMPQIIRAALMADATTISFLAVDVSNPFAFGSRFFTADAAPTDTLPAGSGHLAPAEIVELEAVLSALEHEFAPEFAAGRMAESPAKLRRILVQYFRGLHDPAAFGAPPCNAPHFSTVVEVDGTLRPCYFLPAYGRLRPAGEPLPALMNNAAARALRQAYRSGQRPECKQCVCPLYKSGRALLEMSS